MLMEVSYLVQCVPGLSLLMCVCMHMVTIVQLFQIGCWMSQLVVAITISQNISSR